MVHVVIRDFDLYFQGQSFCYAFVIKKMRNQWMSPPPADLPRLARTPPWSCSSYTFYTFADDEVEYNNDAGSRIRVIYNIEFVNRHRICLRARRPVVSSHSMSRTLLMTLVKSHSPPSCRCLRNGTGCRLLLHSGRNGLYRWQLAHCCPSCLVISMTKNSLNQAPFIERQSLYSAMRHDAG